MACSAKYTDKEDSLVCSICFEKFKTPRYLPCKHSFCQDCLYSYIVSQLDSTEPRLGILCPLCREFIPNVCGSASPEEWIMQFPQNHVLDKHVNSTGQMHCEACLRDNEKEEGTDFCFSCNEKLCGNCTRYHRRNLLTRDHKVVPLTETGRVGLEPYFDQGEICGKHHGRPIEYFCNDHLEPCCTTCVCTTHRICQQVKTVEETALCLKDEQKENFDAILDYVEILEEKLSHAKLKQETLTRQLEDKADEISDDTEKMFDNAINHLQHLKDQCLKNMATGVKKAKEKYEKVIQKLTDGIHCAKYCSKSIGESRMKADASKLVVMYHTGLKCFEGLKRCDFTRVKIDLEHEKPDILEDIMDLSSVSEVNFLEKSVIGRVYLCCISEISLEGKFVRDGTFLSDGTFIFSTIGCKPCQNKPNCKDDCFIYHKSGMQSKRIQSRPEPFGVAVKSGTTFIASSAEKYIQKLSSFGTLISNEINTRCNLKMFGIAFLQENIYMACNDRIIKMPTHGRPLHYQATYRTGTQVKHIASTKSHVVYSKRNTNEVIAMDANGQTVWRYSSPSLKSPCGIGVDGENNIYVAGKESDNIHVLTKDGKVIQVIEDITRPDFMKVDKEKKVCFVCTKRKYLKVYEMKY
ncbi:uncharacterized protein LOC111118816 [Crassostrea virginica]